MKRFVLTLELLAVWIVLSSCLEGINSGTIIANDCNNTIESEEAADVDDILQMNIKLIRSCEMIEIPLEEYICGVVSAEMPIFFEDEALKAQAVAARTYTVRALKMEGKHGKGILCNNAFCCQAYSSESDERIQRLVNETAGEVLTYDHVPIEALFFSCSGGSTEDAVNVWGNDYPYLHGVPSPGEENAPFYKQEYFFTAQEIEERLGVELSRNSAEWIREIRCTDNGTVICMIIAGDCWSGESLRKALELPSASFSIAVKNDRIVFTTYGYGHRVGMSQYGADAMAALGNTYREILFHYYQGTSLESLEP